MSYHRTKSYRATRWKFSSKQRMNNIGASTNSEPKLEKVTNGNIKNSEPSDQKINNNGTKENSTNDTINYNRSSTSFKSRAWTLETTAKVSEFKITCLNVKI